MTHDGKSFGTVRKPTRLHPNHEAEAERHQLERERSEHGRDQAARKLIGYCMLALIFVVSAIILFAVISLAWHMLTPGRLHWLNDGQLGDIKNFMLSGAVVGLGTAYIRRFLDGQ